MDVKPGRSEKLDLPRPEFNSLPETANETLIGLAPNERTTVDFLGRSIMTGHQIQQIRLAILLALAGEFRRTLDKIAGLN
jgi:hypothetical protein